MTQSHISASAGPRTAMPISLVQIAAVSAVAGLVVGCIFAALAIALGAPPPWIVVGVTTTSVIVSLTAVLSEVTVRADRG